MNNHNGIALPREPGMINQGMMDYVNFLQNPEIDPNDRIAVLGLNQMMLVQNFIEANQRLTNQVICLRYVNGILNERMHELENQNENFQERVNVIERENRQYQFTLEDAALNPLREQQIKTRNVCQDYLSVALGTSAFIPLACISGSFTIPIAFIYGCVKLSQHSSEKWQKEFLEKKEREYKEMHPHASPTEAYEHAVRELDKERERRKKEDDYMMEKLSDL